MPMMTMLMVVMAVVVPAPASVLRVLWRSTDLCRQGAVPGNQRTAALEDLGTFESRLPQIELQRNQEVT